MSTRHESLSGFPETVKQNARCLIVTQSGEDPWGGRAADAGGVEP